MKLLLVDTSVIEYALLVESEDLLLELCLNLNDLVSDTLQVDEPLLSLLLNGIFDALLELLETHLFIFVHLFLRLVHPIFTDKFLVNLSLLLLEDEFITTKHLLQTTLAQVIALKEGFLLGATLLRLCHLSTLLGIVESLYRNFSCFIDLKDVFGSFREDFIEPFENEWLFKTLKKVSNLTLSFGNLE